MGGRIIEGNSRVQIEQGLIGYNFLTTIKLTCKTAIYVHRAREDLPCTYNI